MDHQSPSIQKRNKSKTDRENERRLLTNKRFVELYEMIQDDSRSNVITQELILKLALTVVTRLELESSGGPITKGVFKGIDEIEELVISFIKLLEIRELLRFQLTQSFQESFMNHRADQYGIPSTSSGPAPSNPVPIILKTKEERRAEKNEKEQTRRDSLLAGFDGLRRFIESKNLPRKSFSGRIQKLDILEIILGYIREQKNVSQIISAQDQADYSKGISDGHKIATGWAIEFFKNNTHLATNATDLEKYLEFNLNPKPLVGSTLPPIPSPSNAMLVPPTPQLFPFQPVFGLLNQFQVPFPVMIPLLRPTPTGSAGSLPMTSSSDTSARATPACSNNKENVASKTNEGKLFRPWE